LAPGSETVQVFEKNKENCTKILEEAEVIFTLDFNALHRVEKWKSA
jgi:phosphoesterase RecJ-like protein